MAVSAITPAQRYTRGRPCPICHGWDNMRRGEHKRCSGYVSADGLYAYCTREELAGALAPNTRTAPASWAHRMYGPCKCGTTHNAALITPLDPGRPRGSSASSSRRAPRQPEIPAPAPRAIRSGAQEEGERIAAGQEASAQEEKGERRVLWTRPAAEWIYRDRAGAPAYKVVRYPVLDPATGELDKTYVPYRPMAQEGPRKWRAGLAGVSRVPYRLPELLAALASDPGALVYLCEGEKCADALAGLGLTATTTVSGSSSWALSARTMCEELAGRHVVILPDNDVPGEKYAALAAATLAHFAASVRIVRLAGLDPAGDVYDWIAAGHTREELDTLALAAPMWAPDREEIAPAPAIEEAQEEAPAHRRRRGHEREERPGGEGPTGEALPGEALCDTQYGTLTYVSEGEAPGIYLCPNGRGAPYVILAARLDVARVDASEARGRRSMLTVTFTVPGSPEAPATRTFTREEALSAEAYDSMLGYLRPPVGRRALDLAWQGLSELARRASVSRQETRRRYVGRLGWHGETWVCVNGAIDGEGPHMDARILAAAPETWPQRLPDDPATLPAIVDADTVRGLLDFWPASVTLFPYALLGACSAVMQRAHSGRLRWQLELFGNTDWYKTSLVNWGLRLFYGAGYVYNTPTQLVSSGRASDTGLGRSATRAMLAYHAYLDYDYSLKPGRKGYEAQQEERLDTLMSDGNSDGGGSKLTRDGLLTLRPDPAGLLIRTGEPNPYLYSITHGGNLSVDARALTYLLDGASDDGRGERLAASQWLGEHAPALDRLAILHRQWLAGMDTDGAREHWHKLRLRASLLIASRAEAIGIQEGETHTRLIGEQLLDVTAGLLSYAAFLADVDADTGTYARAVRGAQELAQELAGALSAVIDDRLEAMRWLRREYERQQGGVTPAHALASAVHEAIREGLARGDYYYTAPDGGLPSPAVPVSRAAQGYALLTLPDGAGSVQQIWRPRPQARPLAYISADGKRLCCDRAVLETLIKTAARYDGRISYTTLTSVLERLRDVGAIITNPGRLTHQEWIPQRKAPDFTRIAFPLAAIYREELADSGEGEAIEEAQEGASASEGEGKGPADVRPAMWPDDREELAAVDRGGEEGEALTSAGDPGEGEAIEERERGEL